MVQSRIRIGEVAQRAGVSVDTVRYYEKRKLLPRAPRSEGGFRLFTGEAIERVQFIRQAQDVGLSLDEIKTLLTGGDEAECQQMLNLLRAKIVEIDERVKAVREFKLTLAHYLRACEDELATHGRTAKCPVINEITHTVKRKEKNERATSR